MGAHDLQELAQNGRLALTYHELQPRVVRLSEALGSNYATKGKRGRWLVSDAGLEVLVRLRALEGTGASVDSAFTTIAGELAGHKEEPQPEAARLGVLEGELRSLLQRRIAELESSNAELRTEKERLLGLLERTMTLALPPGKAPRRRSLWPFGRR